VAKRGILSSLLLLLLLLLLLGLLADDKLACDSMARWWQCDAVLLGWSSELPAQLICGLFAFAGQSPSPGQAWKMLLNGTFPILFLLRRRCFTVVPLRPFVIQHSFVFGGLGSGCNDDVGGEHG
jgi:hypothetical protein